MLPVRGLAQAGPVVGPDFAGVLQHDGWNSYRDFTDAAHQTCLAHQLRRCRVVLLDHPGHPWVATVKALLQATLATRDAYLAGTHCCPNFSARTRNLDGQGIENTG